MIFIQWDFQQNKRNESFALKVLQFMMGFFSSNTMMIGMIDSVK